MFTRRLRNLSTLRHSGAWFADNDTARVFVGRGLCIETLASAIDEEMAGLKSAPAEQAQHLIAAMISDRMHRKRRPNEASGRGIGRRRDG